MLAYTPAVRVQASAGEIIAPLDRVRRVPRPALQYEDFDPMLR